MNRSSENDKDSSYMRECDGGSLLGNGSHEDEKLFLCNQIFKTKSSRFIMMLMMVVSVFAVEAIVGQLTQSLTLIADSFHMLSDALALVVALLAVNYSKRKAHQRLKPWFSRYKYSNTFGWVRFEVVGALVNATFLLALCLTIAMEAIEKFLKPELMTDPVLVLSVGIGGLVVNLIGLAMFGGHVGHNHSHDHGSHDHGSHNHEHRTSNSEDDDVCDIEKNLPSKRNNSHDQLNVKAVFLHVLGDALGSVVVIITALVVLYVPHKAIVDTPAVPENLTLILNSSCTQCNCTIKETDEVEINRWILFLDPSMSLVLVMILCATTIPLFKQSAMILMQSVPLYIDIAELKGKIRNVAGVKFIHELHVWQLAGEKIIATIHIQVKDAETYRRVATDIKSTFCEVGIHSTTIQPEFENNDQPSCDMLCSNSDCLTKVCCSKEDLKVKILKNFINFNSK